MTAPDPAALAEDLALALSWDGPSRFQIGTMMLALRAAAGDDALWAAVPPAAAQVARECLRVSERWPAAPTDGLAWQHYRTVRWESTAQADRLLALAVTEGWTAAELGRFMATGDDPRLPSMANMAVDLAGAGDLTLRPSGDGEWSVIGPDGETPMTHIQPSIAAAIRAAWRAQRNRKAGEA